MSSPIAHASIGIIGKSIDKNIPLWLLIVATQVPDALFFLFQFMGFEYPADTIIDLTKGYTYLKPAHIPWSHGLLMCGVYSLLMASVVYLRYRRFRVSFAVGCMVMSHWLLDGIVYDNLPLFFTDTPMVGLGLVKSPVGVRVSVAMEIVGAAAILFFGMRKIIRKKKTK